MYHIDQNPITLNAIEDRIKNYEDILIHLENQSGVKEFGYKPFVAPVFGKTDFKPITVSSNEISSSFHIDTSNSTIRFNLQLQGSSSVAPTGSVLKSTSKSQGPSTTSAALGPTASDLKVASTSVCSGSVCSGSVCSSSVTSATVTSASVSSTAVSSAAASKAKSDDERTVTLPTNNLKINDEKKQERTGLLKLAIKTPQPFDFGVNRRQTIVPRGILKITPDTPANDNRPIAIEKTPVEPIASQCDAEKLFFTPKVKFQDSVSSEFSYETVEFTPGLTTKCKRRETYVNRKLKSPANSHDDSYYCPALHLPQCVTIGNDSYRNFNFTKPDFDQPDDQPNVNETQFGHQSSVNDTQFGIGIQSNKKSIQSNGSIQSGGDQFSLKSKFHLSNVLQNKNENEKITPEQPIPVLSVEQSEKIKKKFSKQIKTPSPPKTTENLIKFWPKHNFK